jgi:hypothetical protein
MSLNVVLRYVELSELNLFYFAMKKDMECTGFNICKTYWPVENLVHGCLPSSSSDLELQTLDTLDQHKILFSLHVYSNWKSKHDNLQLAHTYNTRHQLLSFNGLVHWRTIQISRTQRKSYQNLHIYKSYNWGYGGLAKCHNPWKSPHSPKSD